LPGGVPANRGINNLVDFLCAVSKSEKVWLIGDGKNGGASAAEEPVEKTLVW